MREFKKADEFWDTVLRKVKPGHIAMSGGSALQLFDHLKTSGFDWGKTTISVVDERCVPLDHSDSNSGKIKGLLVDTEADLNLFVRPEDRASSMEAYAKTLSLDADDYLFDLTILGVGPDGHTASLFPHSLALDNDDLVVPSETDVFAVNERMGLSFDAISKSRTIIVLMIGAGKKEIFETLKQGNLDYHDYPAYKLLDFPQAEVMWLNA